MRTLAAAIMPYPMTTKDWQACPSDYSWKLWTSVSLQRLSGKGLKERNYNSYKDTDNATTSPSSQRQGQFTAKRSPKGLKSNLRSKQQLENQGGVLGLEGRVSRKPPCPQIVTNQAVDIEIPGFPSPIKRGTYYWLIPDRGRLLIYNRRESKQS